MSEGAPAAGAPLPLATPAGPAATGTRAMFARVAWRNLWRRRLRTWMSAIGIGFAVLLVSLFTAFQTGAYEPWIESATGLMHGHMQLQHPAYQDDPKVAHLIRGGTELVRAVETAPGVAGVAPRTEGFALVSVGERSFGALVMGVDAERETSLFALPHRLQQGEYLPRSSSAYIGSSLAANLGVELGDEIVALGSAREGGVAVLALYVDGIFDTGQAELDRSIMQVPLAAMQEAYELGDSLHRVAIKTFDAGRVAQVAPGVAALLPDGVRLLDWTELLPEVAQGIEIDNISAQMIYWLLMVVVAMSVANAFIMTIFERTREFGMLLAIGMRPNAIVGMLVIEAVCVWALGALLGAGASLAVVLPLGQVGIDVASVAEGMEEMAANIMMPTHIYPALTAGSLLLSPLVMLIGTLAAALVPALRVRRMKPIEALREEE